MKNNLKHVLICISLLLCNQISFAQNDTVKKQNDTVNDTVFVLIKQNKNLTTTEISERLKVSLSTVKRKIKDLKENGIIERIGSDKVGYWKVIEK